MLAQQMKRILFIDASFEQGLIAFGDQTRTFDARFGGSNQIASLVADIMTETPDIIAYGEGPGSYTGLRAAAAFAMGLSCALNRPLVAVPFLAAFPLPCLLDAKSGGIWAYIEDQGIKISLEKAQGLTGPLFSPQPLSQRLERPIEPASFDLKKLYELIQNRPACTNISLNYV